NAPLLCPRVQPSGYCRVRTLFGSVNGIVLPTIAVGAVFFCTHPLGGQKVKERRSLSACALNASSWSCGAAKFRFHIRPSRSVEYQYCTQGVPRCGSMNST